MAGRGLMGSAAVNRYQRSFLIFSNEDSGFEDGKKPSGYLKLEVRDGKGKLDAVLHNLRDGKGRFVYTLYLLRTSSGDVSFLRAGEVRRVSGRNVLELAFDPGQFEYGHFSIEEFEIAAILVEYENRTGSGIICPLAAYRDKWSEWRNGLRKAFQERDVQMPVDSQPKASFDVQPSTKASCCAHSSTEASCGAHSSTEASCGAHPTTELSSAPQPASQASFTPQSAYQASADQPVYQELDDQPVSDTPVNVCSEPVLSSHPHPEPEPAKSANIRTESEKSAGSQSESEPSSDPHFILRPESDHITGNEEPEPASGRQTPEYEQTAPDRKETEAAGSNNNYPGSLAGINTGCVYLNGNLCDAFIAGRSNGDPCSTCRISHNGSPAESQPSGDLEQLQKDLDDSFEASDPFRSRRSDYKWWRVTNPVNLNNILYQNNIRSPLLFNPAVMMAHYKYKHLIIGIFTHRNGRRYVVCGVPGMHMVDMKPFGEMNTWVQAEGNRLKYGAFGYWLVYIDPENGKIMNPK
jgi:hypothetical protein